LSLKHKNPKYQKNDFEYQFLSISGFYTPNFKFFQRGTSNKQQVFQLVTIFTLT